MTEPQPTNAASEEERKLRTPEGAASTARPDADTKKATKEETRSGLRTQGAVDVAPADKPPFVRAYKKAPNLDRPFDAVDMDENAKKDDSIPLVTGAVIKPTEAERTRMPADEPPTPPAPAQDTPEPNAGGQDQDVPPAATAKKGTDAEKTSANKPADAKGTELDD